MLYTLTLPLILSLLLVSLGALAANIPSLPSGWSYTGCLYEGNGQRIMTDEFYGTDQMTISLCVQYCQNKATPYAAIEVGYQCFCGSKLAYVQPVADTFCNYTCHGDSTEMCGGYGYMSFFNTANNDPRVSAGLSPSSTPVTGQNAESGGASGTGYSPQTVPSQSVFPSSIPPSLPSTTTTTSSSTTSVSASFTSITDDPPSSPGGLINHTQLTIPPDSQSRTNSPYTLPSVTPIPAFQAPSTPNFRDGAQFVIFGKYTSSALQSSHVSIFAALSILLGGLVLFT